MLNLSKLVRKSESISLKDKFMEFFNPEIYLAENVEDYNISRKSLSPPWFKRNIFLLSNFYAFIIFYNVGIDGIFEEKDKEDIFVKVHDKSGSKIMCWTEPGELLPAQKSYFEMINNGELKTKDWIYRLVIRHSYDWALPFVSEVEKSRFTNEKKEKSSVANRILHFFPEFGFAPT